jgi:hypothetical protein
MHSFIQIFGLEFRCLIILTTSISAHRINYAQQQMAYNEGEAALITLNNDPAAKRTRY